MDDSSGERYSSSSDDLYDFPDMEAPRISSETKNRCGLYYVMFVGIGAVVVVSVLIYESVQKFSDSSDATAQIREPNLKQTSVGLSIMDINTPPPADENLADVCSNDNIGTVDGFGSCLQECSRGICCVALDGDSVGGIFYGGDNCASDHPEICAQYEPCRNLYNSQDEDLVLLEATLEQTIPEAPSDLAEICASDDLSTCAEECKAGECCSDVSNDSCMDIFPEICFGYLPCDVLEKENPDEEPVEVADICSVDRIASAEGRALCEKTCEPASCCIDKENSCAEIAIDFCEEYKHCDLLAMISASN